MASLGLVLLGDLLAPRVCQIAVPRCGDGQACRAFAGPAHRTCMSQRRNAGASARTHAGKPGTGRLGKSRHGVNLLTIDRSKLLLRTRNEALYFDTAALARLNEG